MIASLMGESDHSQRNHSAIILKAVNMVSPMFHHGTALVEILSTVIGSPYSIVRFMGKLALDDVRLKAHFVECGRGQRSEAMNGRSSMIPHTVQGIEHHAVAHKSFRGGRRKQMRTCVKPRQSA